MKAQAVAQQLLTACRYSHMTGNFLAAIASHHGLLSGQRDLKQWLLESMQWAKASDVQRKDMQVRSQTKVWIVCLMKQLSDMQLRAGVCLAHMYVLCLLKRARLAVRLLKRARLAA